MHFPDSYRRSLHFIKLPFSSLWIILVYGSCVHDAQICFARLFRQLTSQENLEIFKKLLRIFQEVTNNLETIEKLFRNYREMGNYREMIEKLLRNFQKIGNN